MERQCFYRQHRINERNSFDVPLINFNKLFSRAKQIKVFGCSLRRLRFWKVSEGFQSPNSVKLGFFYSYYSTKTENKVDRTIDRQIQTCMYITILLNIFLFVVKMLIKVYETSPPVFTLKSFFFRQDCFQGGRHCGGKFVFN